jgi:hypothetical protein
VAVDTGDVAREEIFITLGLDSGDVEFSVTPNAGIGSGYSVATVRTNNQTGYTLSMVADGESLVCAGHASWTVPSIAADGDLEDDSWGYGVSTTWTGRVPDAPGAGGWRVIPTSAADGVLASPSAPTTEVGDKYGLYFGAKVSYSTPACSAYRQSLTITAVVQ